MKKVIFFTASVTGHNMEYLHHYYEVCASLPEEKFLFIVPSDFEIKKERLKWKPLSNVKFHYLTKEQSSYIENASNTFCLSFRICNILKPIVKKFKPSHLFCSKLDALFPFAPLFFGSRFKIAGIIYSIYLYDWKNSTLKSKCKYYFEYKSFVYHKLYDKILLLNDQSAVCYLNKKNNTQKFKLIVDPVAVEKSSEVNDFRKFYHISQETIVFAHFGGLTIRKGTIDILNSIESLSRKEKEQYCFVFAGKIYDDIRQSFYEKYYQLKDTCNIIVKDEFCDYSFLYDLCAGCDAILMPYHSSSYSMSSGLIGYASAFGKPVMAPTRGLLGKLVKKNNLGIQINSNSVKEFHAFYSKIANKQFTSPSNQYALQHTIKAFCDSILEWILE